MPVRDTSRIAYEKLVASGKAESYKARVLEYLLRHTGKDFTRNELSETLGIRINAICSCINHLVKDGEIRELPPRECDLTGFACHPVEAIVGEPTTLPLQRALL